MDISFLTTKAMDLLLNRIIKIPLSILLIDVLNLYSSLKANSYYFSSSNGDDSNNGTTPSFPIKSISKFNSMISQPRRFYLP